MDGAYNSAKEGLDSIKTNIDELANSFTTAMLDDDTKSAETAKGKISNYTNEVEPTLTALEEAYNSAKSAGNY